MEILTLFKRFQLGNSLFRGKHELSNEMLKHSMLKEAEMIEIAKRQIAMQLSEMITKQHKNAITHKQEGDMIIIESELLVLELKDLKNIVEAAIEIMSEHDIAKIKNGISVIK
jgi:hypothetical protein